MELNAHYLSYWWDLLPQMPEHIFNTEINFLFFTFESSTKRKSDSHIGARRLTQVSRGHDVMLRCLHSSARASGTPSPTVWVLNCTICLNVSTKYWSRCQFWNIWDFSSGVGVFVAQWKIVCVDVDVPFNLRSLKATRGRYSLFLLCPAVTHHSTPFICCHKYEPEKV